MFNQTHWLLLKYSESIETRSFQASIGVENQFYIWIYVDKVIAVCLSFHLL